MKQRLLSVLLACCLLVALLPTGVLADFTIIDGTVQGTVVDAETQEPIGVEATVTLYAKGDMDTAVGSTTSNATDGTFTLPLGDSFAEGEYVLVASQTLYLSRTVELGNLTRSGLAISSPIGLTPAGRTSGTVTDADTGEALGGVTVSVYRDETLITSAMTGADGKYSIEMSSGVYDFKFVLDGYKIVTLENKVLGAITTTNDVQLQRSEDTVIVDSGVCGANLTWSLDSDGVLTISGSGAMDGWSGSAGGYSWTFYKYVGKSQVKCSTTPWISYCDDIKLAIIGDGVTSIGSCSFASCSSLENVIIPDSVTAINGSAFAGCISLTYIPISENVTKIGDDAFCLCRSLSKISIPHSVTDFGTGVFENCSSLTSAGPVGGEYSIDFGWAESIPEYAFYNCSGLKDVVIPYGITTIGREAFRNCYNLTNVIIPNTVTNIETQTYEYYARGHGYCTGYSGCFQGCRSLQNIIIPGSITEIGPSTFENCTSLSNVVIEKGVKVIGGAAFYGCTSLESISIPDTVTFIGADTRYEGSVYLSVLPAVAYDCFGACEKLKDVFYLGTKEQWDEINIISPNTNLNRARFHYNSSGPLPTLDNAYTSFSGIIPSDGTSPTTNFTTKLYVYEYSTLKELSDYNIAHSNGNLTLSLDDYYPVSVPFCTLSFGATTKLTLVPASNGSNISAVHCDGKDALTNPVTIDSGETSLKIYVYSSLLDDQIERFELMQDASVIATSPTGEFSIRPGNVTLGKAFSVRVIKTGGIACAKIKTNIKVSDNHSVPDISISYGSGFKFGVPDDVPLIGGGDISIDFALCPVDFSIKGDTYRISIGLDSNIIEDDDSWLNVKKFFEGIDKNLEKGLKVRDLASAFGIRESGLLSNVGAVSAGVTPKLDMDVYGYVEGTITSSGKGNQVNGTVVMEISGKVGQEWQVMVAVVPVVVKFSAEAGVQTVMSVGFDFDKAEIYFEGEATLTLPKLTVSAGIGIVYVADISVYGSAKNDVTISTKTDSITAALSGELGVSAKLLFWSYKKTLLKGNWQYYYYSPSVTNTASLMATVPDDINLMTLSPDNYQIDRNYARTQSGWLDAARDTREMVFLQSVNLDSGGNSTKTLQTSVYYSAAPKLVITDNGLRMMVWTADITSRTTGNHTAVVYSIYDSSTDTWSEPEIIADDGTADFHPSVATDGTDIYVVWMDSSRSDFNDDSSIADIAASCDITAAVYENGSWTVSRLTENSIADVYPTVSVVNGVTYAAWLANSESDILTLSGTNTILYASNAGTGWSNVHTFAGHDKPVAGVAVGKVGSVAAIAFTLDADGDISTTEDVELYCGTLSNTPVALTSNRIQEENAHFAVLGNTPILVWYADGNLCYSSDLSTVSTISGPSGGISPYFSIVDCDDTQVLISVLSGDNGSEIYLYNIDGSEIGEPVAITYAGEYITDFSAAHYGNLIHAAFTKTAATITDDTVEESTDLCVLTVGAYSNLALENIIFDQSAVSDGATLPIEITVKNNGTVDETQVNITAELTNSMKLNKTVDVDIPMGETVTFTVDLPLEASVSSGSSYTFTVISSSQGDFDSDDNSLTITLGYTDLRLSAEKVQSGAAYAALVTVENLSCIDTTATLYVYEQDSSRTALAAYDLEEIKAGTSETFKIDTALLNALVDNGSTLYFEAVADEDEYYISDNYDFIYLENSGIQFSNLELDTNGGTLTGTVRCESSLESTDAVFIVAFYNGNGKMLGAWTKTTSLANEIQLVVSGEPLDADQAKLFLVQDGSWTSLCETVEITL